MEAGAKAGFSGGTPIKARHEFGADRRLLRKRQAKHLYT
jgi:hypothetical protein